MSRDKPFSEHMTAYSSVLLYCYMGTKCALCGTERSTILQGSNYTFRKHLLWSKNIVYYKSLCHCFIHQAMYLTACVHIWELLVPCVKGIWSGADPKVTDSKFKSEKETPLTCVFTYYSALNLFQEESEKK